MNRCREHGVRPAGWRWLGVIPLLVCSACFPGLAQETHRTVTTVSLESVPVACSVSPDNTKLVITTADDQVLFYSLKQGRILARVRLDGAPLYVHRLDRKMALVGRWNARSISVLDLFGNRVLRSVMVGDGPTFFGQDDRSVLLVLTRARKLTFLNPYTFKPAGSVAFDGEPSGLAVAAGRGRAYVAVGMKKIAVIDLASRVLLHSFDLITARDTPLVVDAGERWLYALGLRNSVVRISLADERENKRISTGSGATAMSLGADGKYLYVTNGLDGKLSILDAESLTYLEQISVGSRPACVEASPDGLYVFVCNRGSKSISILARASGG